MNFLQEYNPATLTKFKWAFASSGVSVVMGEGPGQRRDLNIGSITFSNFL